MRSSAQAHRWGLTDAEAAARFALALTQVSEIKAFLRKDPAGPRHSGWGNRALGDLGLLLGDALSRTTPSTSRAKHQRTNGDRSVHEIFDAHLGQRQRVAIEIVAHKRPAANV